jgi:hypothetical protein
MVSTVLKNMILIFVYKISRFHTLLSHVSNASRDSMNEDVAYLMANQGLILHEDLNQVRLGCINWKVHTG